MTRRVFAHWEKERKEKESARTRMALWVLHGLLFTWLLGQECVNIPDGEGRGWTSQPRFAVIAKGAFGFLYIHWIIYESSTMVSVGAPTLLLHMREVKQFFEGRDVHPWVGLRQGIMLLSSISWYFRCFQSCFWTDARIRIGHFILDVRRACVCLYDEG